MKIGIITQPLETNYGGLLQNYALQRVMRDLGHNVYTLNKKPFDIYTCRWDVIIRWEFKRYINKLFNIEYPFSQKEYCNIKKNCAVFVEDNISTTKLFRSNKKLKKIIKEHKFDAYVVGSDQVWRPCYSYNIFNDFLAFCKEQTNVKRIAYATSFGVNEWEFNKKETKKCCNLAKLFDAISVREESGIALCKDYLGVNAIQVLDPTLLLEKEDYIKLVEKAKEPVSEGKLFCYVIDNNEQIEKCVKNIENELSLKSFKVKAKNDKWTLKRREDINDHIIPSPNRWLRAFMDAEMVFTDSFHGCAFSIIFNKPFWVIGNKKRGNARFDSLLNLFNLENRRVDINDISNIDLTLPINWDKVNSIKKEWQEKSINFLKENL